MCKYLLDHRRVFDTSNHLDCATAYFTSCNINVENPFQALCPGYRGVTACGCAVICFTVFLALVALASFCRCNQRTMLAIRCEHAVESSQVNPGLWHQSSKPSNEIKWLEDDVGSAIPIRCLQLIADVADWRKRKPLFRNRRTTDVSSGPPADRRSSFLRSSVLAATPACREKPDALPAVSA